MSNSTLNAIPGKVALGSGFHWVKIGAIAFSKMPANWMFASLMMLAILTLVLQVPYVSAMIGAIVQIVIYGAFSVAAGKSNTRDFWYSFKNTFKTKLKPLIYGGLISSGLTLLIVTSIAISSYVLSFLQAKLSADAVSVVLALLMLSALIALVAALLSIWFMPALIVYKEMKPLAAMKASLGACTRNPIQMLTLFIMAGILSVMAIQITYGLGMLIVIPITACASYQAFKDIFQPEPVYTQLPVGLLVV